MKIKVTKEHIKRGEASMCNTCPIALAIRETLNTREVYVEDTIIYVYDDRFVLPGIARAFIIAFDAGGDVQPFSFELVKV